MANIKSQIKRNRQNEVRRQRNKGERSSLRTKIKNFVSTVESGDTAKAQESYPEITRALDQAAAKGLIHKRKAANQKSRLAKKLASK
jgi:small subunit ribosomal protein S20